MNYGPTNNFTPSRRSLSATVSKGRAKQLYFTTATSSAHAGRVPGLEDRAQNTKFRHMGVVDVSDNLLPRTHNQIELNEKPNPGGYKMNCELAVGFRPPAGKFVPFDAQNSSTYADFIDKSGKRHASRVRPCPPPEPTIAGCFAGQRETGISHSAEQHSKPEDQSKPIKWVPMHNLFIREKPADFWQTRYQAEHCTTPPKVEQRRRKQEPASPSRFQRSASVPASAVGPSAPPSRSNLSHLSQDSSEAWCVSSSQQAYRHPEAAYAMDQKRGTAAVKALRAHLASTA